MYDEYIPTEYPIMPKSNSIYYVESLPTLHVSPVLNQPSAVNSFFVASGYKTENEIVLYVKD